MEGLRIFLVWEHPLLREMVRLILQQAGLSLMGDARNKDVLPILRAGQPDVILVEDVSDMPGFLLMHMEELGTPRLVRLSLEDNKLHIYQHEERLVTHPSDLVHALGVSSEK